MAGKRAFVWLVSRLRMSGSPGVSHVRVTAGQSPDLFTNPTWSRGITAWRGCTRGAPSLCRKCLASSDQRSNGSSWKMWRCKHKQLHNKPRRWFCNFENTVNWAEDNKHLIWGFICILAALRHLIVVHTAKYFQFLTRYSSSQLRMII